VCQCDLPVPSCVLHSACARVGGGREEMKKHDVCEFVYICVCLCVCMHVCVHVCEWEGAGEVHVPYIRTATSCNTRSAIHCNTLTRTATHYICVHRLTTGAEQSHARCAAVCCRCCSVLQCVAVCCSEYVAVCCSAWQCVRCSMWQCVVVRCSAWQCVAVRGSVLQCAADVWRCVT